MKRLNCQIQIGSYNFNYVCNINTESTWEEFTNTCTIELPNKFQTKNKTLIEANGIFKRGDYVVIKTGYYPTLTQIFVGYISQIKIGSPFIVECQDTMWLLKQHHIKSYSGNGITLKELMQEVMPTGANYEVIDCNLGQLRINNANLVEVFEELKSTYGLLTWCRNNVVYIGLAYYPSMAITQTFSFEKNIKSDSSSLEYRREDDVNIVVKGVSMKPDNSKIEIYCYKEEGEIKTSTAQKDGETRILHFYNLNQADLIEAVKRELPRLVYEGYYGDFTTLGSPDVNYGDYAYIESKKYPERNGTYVIKKVNKEFGNNGYRQQITLDKKIS